MKIVYFYIMLFKWLKQSTCQWRENSKIFDKSIFFSRYYDESTMNLYYII